MPHPLKFNLAISIPYLKSINLLKYKKNLVNFLIEIEVIFIAFRYESDLRKCNIQKLKRNLTHFMLKEH